MIQTFVDKFIDNRPVVEAVFAEKHVHNYIDIVKTVVNVLHDPDEYNSIDPDRIEVIDHGDYQGTLLFVIGASGYQPDDYWAVKVYYGSCSGCDTLQAIHEYSDDKPTPEQVQDYYTLALHVVQGLTKIGE